MMKYSRLNAIFLSFLMAGSMLAGCSSSSDSSSSSDTSADAETTDSSDTTDSASQSDPSKGDLGDYYVEIGDARIVQDYSGNNAIAVTFNFTNNSDDATSFDASIYPTLYQDGVQLDIAFVSDLDSKADNKIKPGTSITVEQAYELTSDSDVEVDVEELFSFSDDELTKTFVLSDLQ
jgi:ABC-type transport system substrate-binding protein